MLINCMSDLHNEFHEVMPEQAKARIPKGDVLLLAGDIFVLKSHHKLKYFQEFLKIVNDKYDKVIAVAGNHEPYGKSLDDLGEVRKIYEDSGVVFLDDEHIDINGVRFFGGTLWPNMNNDDFATKLAVKNYLNDYRVIAGLSPDEAVRRHRATIARLRETRPDVVVTHMAPALGSIHPRYASAGLANYGYYSDVDIPEYVKLWFHGHVHHQVDYVTGIGSTRVIANPRGYPHETRHTGFRFDRLVKLPLGQQESDQIEVH